MIQGPGIIQMASDIDTWTQWITDYLAQNLLQWSCHTFVTSSLYLIIKKLQPKGDRIV